MEPRTEPPVDPLDPPDWLAAARDVRWGVMTNPAARDGRAGRIGTRIAAELDRLGIGWTDLSGTSAEGARNNLRDTTDVEALVVVGGDGAAALAANARPDLPFGVVPAGTGNDLARWCGHDLGEPVAALRAILADAPSVLRSRTGERAGTAVDAGMISGPEGGRLFIGTLSLGFDAAVNARAHRMARPRGAMKYHVALLAELARLAPRTFSIDGDRFKATMVSVINLPTMGGGIPVLPSADPTDGRLAVLIVAPLGRWKLASLLPLLALGKHLGRPEVQVRWDERIDVAAFGALAYADGDPVGTGPFRVVPAPGALSVLGVVCKGGARE